MISVRFSYLFIYKKKCFLETWFQFLKKDDYSPTIYMISAYLFWQLNPQASASNSDAAVGTSTTSNGEADNTAVPDDIFDYYDKIDKEDDEDETTDLKTVVFEIKQESIEDLQKR